MVDLFYQLNYPGWRSLIEYAHNAIGVDVGEWWFKQHGWFYHALHRQEVDDGIHEPDLLGVQRLVGKDLTERLFGCICIQTDYAAHELAQWLLAIGFDELILGAYAALVFVRKSGNLFLIYSYIASL